MKEEYIISEVQDGNMTVMDYVLNCLSAEEYEEFCRNRGCSQDEASALLFMRERSLCMEKSVLR